MPRCGPRKQSTSGSTTAVSRRGRAQGQTDGQTDRRAASSILEQPSCTLHPGAWLQRCRAVDHATHHISKTAHLRRNGCARAARGSTDAGAGQLYFLVGIRHPADALSRCRESSTEWYCFPVQTAEKFNRKLYSTAGLDSAAPAGGGGKRQHSYTYLSYINCFLPDQPGFRTFG
eukprot:COSAG02_NODE_5065_length_4677_cov_1.343818_3_plen_174_part_00